MSSMIQCDRCHKMMYSDSRSSKGAYCKIGIDYTDGYSTLHLCSRCHRIFMLDFLGEMTLEEYIENYGEWEEDEND